MGAEADPVSRATVQGQQAPCWNLLCQAQTMTQNFALSSRLDSHRCQAAVHPRILRPVMIHDVLLGPDVDRMTQQASI
jgi:hypothetical protein